MELKLNIAYQQVLYLLKQLPVTEWEKLRTEIDKGLIKKEQKSVKKEREYGCMKGVVAYMADDFNAPLDDFKDYM